MSKHTPLPWSIEDAGDDVHHVVDANGRYVLMDCTEPVTLLEVIVKAVNCHADLLAACKSFMAVTDKYGEWVDGCFYFNDRSSTEFEGPINLAHNAIAKVEKKP